MRGTQWGGDCWSKIGRVTCQFGKGLLYAVYSSFGRIHVRQNVFANQRFACWHCGLHKTYSGFLQVDHDACDPVARENRSVLLFAAVFLATFATARWSDMVIPFLSHDHFNVIHHQRGGRVQCTFSANIRDKELNAALLDSAKPRNSAIELLASRGWHKLHENKARSTRPIVWGVEVLTSEGICWTSEEAMKPMFKCVFFLFLFQLKI